MLITDEHVKKFKLKNKIYHSREDEIIKDALKSSYLFITNKCGDFSIDNNHEGAELVYNRARYEYNEALEYFDNNFMSMVTNFALKNLDFEEDVTVYDSAD